MADQPTRLTPKFACPDCGSYLSLVIDSRPFDGRDGVKRRRLCTNCGHRYTTVEIILGQPRTDTNRHNI